MTKRSASCSYQRRAIAAANFWLPLALIVSPLALGCADRDRDGTPDQAQANVPGSAANTASGVTDNVTTTAKIKNALITDPAVSAAKIDVDTKDDVVTLSGEVESEAKKKKAGEIAASYKGSRRVVNTLKVTPKG
jgi:hypothetical protein